MSAASSVVGLHGTDPSAGFIAAWARTEGAGIADLEAALYDDRSLVRVLAMRRTVFLVPTPDAPVVLGGASDDVARDERRKFRQMLTAAEVEDPDAWLAELEPVALAAIERLGEVSSAELAAVDERLAMSIMTSTGTRFATAQKVASRLLLVLSAEGRVVRTRPKGSWTSSQFRWATLSTWAPEAAVEVDPVEAEAALARLWLARFGPALPDDLTWWTRWTKTRTRRALAAAGAVEVDLGGTTGIALPDDLEPTPEVEPWGALLPALDATTMGWKQRDWYLGDHGNALFDVNGNAGPTIWWDGRIVGGWAHLPSGEVALRLLDDVGAEAVAALEAYAVELAELVGDVRLTARGRGYCPVEKELLGR